MRTKIKRGDIVEVHKTNGKAVVLVEVVRAPVLTLTPWVFRDVSGRVSYTNPTSPELAYVIHASDLLADLFRKKRALMSKKAGPQ